MTKTPTKVALIAAALALGVSSTALYAQTDAGSQSEITLDQAIAIAEAETGGTVLEAEWETEDGVRLIEIEMNTATGELEVLIDPVSGDVLSVEADDDDDDDGDEDGDDEDADDDDDDEDDD